jgi:hypothetical protein
MIEHDKAYARWLKSLCEACHEIADIEGFLNEWGYCTECAEPLTPDMVEDEEWIQINEAGSRFPVCASCEGLA